ncbi:hypothetical protein D918_04172, partial [Trichuris suis]
LIFIPIQQAAQFENEVTHSNLRVTNKTERLVEIAEKAKMSKSTCMLRTTAITSFVGFSGGLAARLPSFIF